MPGGDTALPVERTIPRPSKARPGCRAMGQRSNINKRSLLSSVPYFIDFNDIGQTNTDSCSEHGINPEFSPSCKRV